MIEYCIKSDPPGRMDRWDEIHFLNGNEEVNKFVDFILLVYPEVSFNIKALRNINPWYVTKPDYTWQKRVNEFNELMYD